MLNSILFVGWYPNPKDEYKNVFFQNLVFAIADSGIKCTVISPVSITKYRSSIRQIPLTMEQRTPNGKIVRVYYPRYLSASSKKVGRYNTEIISEELFELAVVRQAKKIETQFDAVYGHFFLYGGIAAVRVGRLLHLPSFVAYGECDFDSQVKNTFGIPKKKHLDGLKGIVSVSTKNTNELKALHIVAENVPIITAPNSTDLSLFYKKNKIECRKKFNIPLDLFVVGFVGGFIERKGDKRLLAALNRIEGAYGAFAGKGDNPPSGEKVIFCNSLEHEKICDFLNALDIFCLPTLNEGSCNAIVEAMACGVPIISSDLPFNDDILDDTISIRINPNSVDEIEAAIVKMMQNDNYRNDLSNNCLAKSRNFRIEERASKIVDFMDIVINSIPI